MTTPSSNIGLSDVYWEANGGGSGSPGSSISFKSLASASYFEGPNGNNLNSFNGWGLYGNSAGANRIYNTSISTGNYSLNSFANKTYFYDQTNYKVILNVTNNLGPGAPFPPPGTDTTVQDVNLTLRDSSNTYSYLTAGTGPVNFGGGNTTFDASTINTPIINTAYWTITIGSNPQFPGALADLTINGTLVFSNQPVSVGPASTTFNFNTWGTQDVYYNGTNYGFDFVLTIH